MRSNPDPALQRALAEEIKARRSALKINQDLFALRCGMNRSFVAKLEVGATSLSIQSLFRLAQHLELDPSELVSSLQRRYASELKAAGAGTAGGRVPAMKRVRAAR